MYFEKILFVKKYIFFRDKDTLAIHKVTLHNLAEVFNANLK